MILYVLNPELEIIKVVDAASSVIWTRRYYEAGDFEIYIKADDETRKYLSPGNYVMRFDSDTAYVIESLKLQTDVENGDYLTITGQDLKSLVKRRIVWKQTTLSGTLKDCVKQLLTDNVISPDDSARALQLSIGDYSIRDIHIEAQYTGDDIYEVITALCKANDVGWNIRITDDRRLEFYMYEGSDRSYGQTENDYVTFSYDFENIVTSEYAYDKSELKNVALVAGEGEGVYRRNYTVGQQAGEDRREVFIDARDITSDTGEEVTESFSVSSRNKSHVFSNYIYSINKVTITDPDTSVGSYDSDNYIHNNQSWDNRTVYFNDCTSGWNSDTGKEIYRTYRVSVTYNRALSPDEYNKLLEQRGLEKLAELQAVEGLSGEVDSTRQYVVDKDFYLGDIVQIENEYGIQARPRIIEIIEAEDADGISVIPTFATWEVI